MRFLVSEVTLYGVPVPERPGVPPSHRTTIGTIGISGGVLCTTPLAPLPPKPHTRPCPKNLKPDNRKPKIKNRKPKIGTRNPKPETRNPKPGTWDPRPDTRDPKLGTRDPRPEARTHQGREGCVQGYLAPKKERPLGPHIRHMPRALWWSQGGGGSHEQGNPVVQAGGP
jgi:hypothetical protein